jgi:tryptophanyl-tRNA synthetase
MIQFKEKKAGKSDQKTGLSLYSYPVLMAADILCYRANLVPVGEDQTQHLELSRDIAVRFNRLFGGTDDSFFPLPDKLSFDDSLCVYNRVMSLQDASKKMSKSDPSKKACINLIDDPEMIRLKIQKAKTDSLGKVTILSFTFSFL